jgi:hypothetical protein
MSEFPDIDDRSYATGLFLHGLTKLRVDDEGCAPSDWEDVGAVALLCPNVRLALAGATSGSSPS